MYILSTKNPEQLNKKGLESVNVIELRADYLEDTSKEHLATVITELKKFGKPILFSLFSKREGGNFPNNEKEIFQRLHWALELGCEYISFEAHWSKENQRKLLKKVKGQGLQVKNNTQTIATFHHSEKTYTKDGLRHIARRCLYTKADIIRLEFHANDIGDNLKIFELTDFVKRKYKKPIIAYAQGPQGKLSHIIGEPCGSWATFVANPDEKDSEFYPLEEIEAARRIL